MTRTVDRDVSALEEVVGGAVLRPGDEGYDDARAVWHGDIDQRPAVLVRCRDAADVVAALAFARAHDLEVSVRGGGHGHWGTFAADGGLTVDLGPIDHVVVDPDARLARVGGGATLAKLDAATQEHALAVPAGTVSHTGVGGLTLGGGFGWLTPQHGLTIDNLESAQVVLADGRCVRAAADEHPDLFWALRGGGGNFGVVTEFTFRLHPVGPVVQVAMLFAEQARAAAMFRATRDATAALPRTVTVATVAATAPPAPFVPQEHRGRPVVIALVIGFGSVEEHAAAVDGIRAATAPAFEMATPMPYTALQQILDDGAPWGTHGYSKGLYLHDLTDATIDALAAQLDRPRSPGAELLLFPFTGAYGDVAEDATALGGDRTLRWCFVIEAMERDAATFDDGRAWVRETWTALRPSAAHSGSYVNLMAEYEEGGLRDTYGAGKFDRLRRIKADYDPDNLFHLNANIPPAA